jgi:hypothetical protein
VRLIRWYIETATPRDKLTGIIQVDDNADGQQIDAEIRLEVFDVVEWGWDDVTDKHLIEAACRAMGQGQAAK